MQLWLADPYLLRFHIFTSLFLKYSRTRFFFKDGVGDNINMECSRCFFNLATEIFLVRSCTRISNVLLLITTLNILKNGSQNFTKLWYLVSEIRLNRHTIFMFYICRKKTTARCHPTKKQLIFSHFLKYNLL